MNSRTEVELTERPHLETPREFQISIRLGQMSNSNEAENTDFEHFVASVLSHEQIHSQRGHPALDLNIKPDEVLPVEEHQADELLVDVLRERLKRKPRNVRLEEAQELVQHFAFYSDDLTII